MEEMGMSLWLVLVAGEKPIHELVQGNDAQRHGLLSGVKA